MKPSFNKLYITHFLSNNDTCFYYFKDESNYTYRWVPFNRNTWCNSKYVYKNIELKIIEEIKPTKLYVEI